MPRSALPAALRALSALAAACHDTAPEATSSVEDAAPADRTPRPIMPKEAEVAAHATFVAKKLKEPLWLQPPFAPPAEPQG